MKLPIVKSEVLEESLIASALVIDEVKDELSLRLNEDDFTIPQCRQIFRVVKEVTASGGDLDIAILLDKLGEEYADYIARLYTLSTSKNVIDKCRKLQALTVTRNMAKNMYQALLQMNSNVDDYEKFNNSVLEQITSVSIENKHSRLEHISTSFASAIEDLQKIQQGEEVGFKTGIADIDRQTNGFRRGEYIIVAGRPAQGKTSLALTMIKNMAKVGHTVAMFSLEMTTKQVTNKLASMITSQYQTEVPLSVFRGTSMLTQEHHRSYQQALAEMKELKIYVNDSARTTITDIEVELRRFVKKHNVDVVVIDYIGLVNSDNVHGRKRHELIQEFSHKLQGIFKDLQVVGIVIVQMNRDAHNRKPNMSNLAESSQLERDADMIYLLWEPDKDDKTRKILIADKGRGVQSGEFALHFSTSTTEFMSMSRSDAEEYFNEISNGDEEDNVYRGGF